MNFVFNPRITLLCLSLIAADVAAQEIDFVRDIRPILSENCVFCHGPDENERQADLRLDTHDGALSVIEPGIRSDSELFDRLTTDDADAVMPPPDSNRHLSAKQIEMLGAWIDAGGKWEKHWSFTPIQKPVPPKIIPAKESPIRNPIDSFVQHQLLNSPLKPSPQANRRILIRRLSLDLTGLPPTQSQVDAFLNDTADGAYDRLVDRFLKSPAYGQRMAWDWLDAARYADTNGYQGDRERTMWPWRDWVVKAFNENMPYDDFTLWQLAGDQLPDATDEQILATGFCRNHMINGEGGRIAEENRVEYVMDMSETMGTVWLGLTLNCCRCHDHKYDPITNEDYYQFFAFFNQTPVKGNGGDPQTAPNLTFLDQGKREQLKRVQEQIAKADADLKSRATQLSKTQADWESKRRGELTQTTRWQILDPEKVSSINQQDFKTLSDKSILVSGKNPDNDDYTLVATTNLQTITALRLEGLRHESMTQGGIARSNSGNFVLTSLELYAVDPDEQTESGKASGGPKAPKSTGNPRRKKIEFAAAQATFEQGQYKVGGLLDPSGKSGWAVYSGKSIERDHAAVLLLQQPFTPTKNTKFEIVLRHQSQHKNHNLGRFRLSLTDAPEPKLVDQPNDLVAALEVPAAERNSQQRSLIRKGHQESDSQYTKQKRERDQLAKRRDDLQRSAPKVMVMQDMDKPRDTFVLDRGLYNKPTEKVTRDFPDFLPKPKPSKLAGSTPNRLALANWIVSNENPLTARVTVNRLWQQFFGIGLVKTTEDFGRQGEIPLHMDLLNWLASDFRESGWDVKAIVRKMVTSHAYRQTSVATAKAYEIDPDNRLLARAARFRMPSWMIRDQALAASGLLSSVDSGPSVNSYQPPGVWEDASFGKKKYTRDSGEKLYRRSLYVYWRRIIAPTMFFDNATRQTCTVKTAITNTPLHALQTLNNVAYVESARALAELALKQGPADENVILNRIMQRVLAREATRREKDILISGLQRTRNEFQMNDTAAKKLLAVGESPRDQSIDIVQHASWTALCLAVLNFDETLNRE